jgi:hypothetical protein
LNQAFDGVPIRIEKRFKTSPLSLFTVVVAENEKQTHNGHQVPENGTAHPS